jgi:predicted 2-oxoglutarate/Fe(II)-dependent dioxygenase YbiX
MLTFTDLLAPGFPPAMNRASRLGSRVGPQLFTRGELLPRLPVRDETGRSDNLRAVLEGAPAVLIYLSHPADSSAREAARRFAELVFAIPRLSRALLLPASARGPNVLALADLGLKILIAQRENDIPADVAVPIATIADPAGRVLETHNLPGSQVSQLVERTRHALAPADENTGAARSRTAPVLMIPDVLTANQCRRLIAHFERSEAHPSGVLDLSGPEPQWRPDPTVKSRRDLRLEDPALNQELERAMATQVLPEMRKCFHYVVTHHEPFKLVRYDGGEGYFRPHRDNESRDTDYRRFAMTLNLNTGDYVGGALNFPEFGPATYHPPAGGAIVFSCSLLHEATDVTRGSRYVALGFFYNPADGLTPDHSRQ